MHPQIADSLREQFASTAAAEPELVAHHLTQTGLDEPAIEWWGKAGDQAVRPKGEPGRVGLRLVRG